ncbi:MAG: SGNH/GDSL hydrolase family protein [Candidatus Thorarchaeota archaeon]
MDIYQIAAICIVLVGIIVVFLYIMKLRSRLNKEDPTFWQGEIKAFDLQDKENNPPDGSILFIGSSSIRYWKTLKEDMAPLQVLNRGFGGSRISDVIHYIDQIVFPYKPNTIVFYAGENDLSGLFYTTKKTPEEVRDNFQIFCDKVHVQLPEVPIYFISIKPPKRRKNLWPDMQRANSLIEDFCNTSELLHYIDIVPPMLDVEGNPRKDLFRWDGIHMNDLGYEIWASTIRDILIQHQS